MLHSLGVLYDPSDEERCLSFANLKSLHGVHSKGQNNTQIYGFVWASCSLLLLYAEFMVTGEVPGRITIADLPDKCVHLHSAMKLSPSVNWVFQGSSHGYESPAFVEMIC